MPDVLRSVRALVTDTDSGESYFGYVDRHEFNCRGSRDGRAGSWFDCRDGYGWGSLFVPDAGGTPLAFFSGEDV